MKALPAQRIKELLLTFKGVYSGSPIDQLTHSLQTATRALREGGSDEMILICLCHDLGKALSKSDFPAATAELLKPYVSEQAYWIIQHQNDFEQYKTHPACADAIDLREWNQNSYDPRYRTLPLEFFEPLLSKFFARH